MNIAVEVTETKKRTIIVDADNYEEAEKVINQEYETGGILLDWDNSQVNLSCRDVTESHINIFGEKDFSKFKSEFKQ